MLKEIVGIPAMDKNDGRSNPKIRDAVYGARIDNGDYNGSKDAVQARASYLQGRVLLSDNDADDTEVSEGEAEVVEILLGRQKVRSPEKSTASPVNSSHSAAATPLSSSEVSGKRAREEADVVWDVNWFPEPPFRNPGTVHHQSGVHGAPVAETSTPGASRSQDSVDRPIWKSTWTGNSSSFSKRFFTFKKQQKTTFPADGGDRRRTIVYTKNFLPALPQQATNNSEPNLTANSTNDHSVLSNAEKKQQYDSLARSEKAVTEKQIAILTEKKRLERLEADKIISFPGYGYEHPSKVGQGEESARRSKSSRKSKKSRRKKQAKPEVGANGVSSSGSEAVKATVPEILSDDCIPNTKRHQPVGRDKDVGSPQFVKEKYDGQKTGFSVDIAEVQEAPTQDKGIVPTIQLNNVWHSNLPPAKLDTALTTSAVPDLRQRIGKHRSDEQHTGDELSPDDVLLSPFGPASVRLTTVETEAVIYNYYMSSRASALDSATPKSPSSVYSLGLAITTPTGIYEDATPATSDNEDDGIHDHPSIRRLSSLLEVIELQKRTSVLKLDSATTVRPFATEGVYGTNVATKSSGKALQKLDEVMRQLVEAT